MHIVEKTDRALLLILILARDTAEREAKRSAKQIDRFRIFGGRSALVVHRIERGERLRRAAAECSAGRSPAEVLLPEDLAYLRKLAREGSNPTQDLDRIEEIAKEMREHGQPEQLELQLEFA